ALEMLRIEVISSNAMPKKQPADDASARVQRHDHLGSESIEAAAQQRALRAINRLRERIARDQMRLPFKPAHERVALAKFQLGRFRQTAQACAQPVPVALADFGKNADPGYTRSIREIFHHTAQQRIDRVEPAEDTGET